MTIKAYAAQKQGGELSEFQFELGKMGSHQVDIDVEYCGICHSDLNMLDNEWGMTQYPLVPGHEIVGIVKEIGSHVKHVKVGQRVGLGWYSGSCMNCEWCMSGDHNLCRQNEATIVGRFGGFADTVRANEEWCTPLPAGVDPAKAGPMFCGGITVYNPIVQNQIRPTDRVGVVGIGGLGHMALKFLNAWGCDVTAFSGSPNKEKEARSFGANHFVNSRDPKAVQDIAESLDFILVTVNASLDWESYITALRPKGKLHFVGAVLEPVSFGVFSLLGGQKSISASPLGSPATTAQMMDFAARHDIAPTVEEFAMKDVNKAIDKLRNGSPRYRLVLKR